MVGWGGNPAGRASLGPIGPRFGPLYRVSLFSGPRAVAVVPGREPTIYARGFTKVTDLAFGRDGSLYVLEFTTNGILSEDFTGALKRVRPNGSQETVVSEGLMAPTGVAVSRTGEIYISNFGALAGAGQVVKVKPGR